MMVLNIQLPEKMIPNWSSELTNMSEMKSLAEAVPTTLIMLIVPDFIVESVILAIDSSIPIDEDRVVQTAEMQGIKLLSSFDPSDLFQVGCIHALYPWNNPKGYFLALYFPFIPTISKNVTMEMETLTLMLGTVIDRSFSNIAHMMMDKIYTEMENSLSRISETLASLPLGTSSEENNHSNELDSQREEIKKILHDIRMNIQSMIKVWLNNLNLFNEGIP